MNPVALFPLNTVLFPGGKLALQIFEPRYLDMIKACMKQEQGFVVVLIKEGREAGDPATFHEVGTYAEIIDWGQLDNGLLTITVEGRQRVKVISSSVQADGLQVGELDYLIDDATPIPPAREDSLLELLAAIELHPAIQAMDLTVDTNNLNSVLWSLAGVLPFSTPDKQDLLELDTPRERLDLFQLQLDALEKMA